MKLTMKQESLATAALTACVTLLMLLYVAAPYLAGLSDYVFCSHSIPTLYETQIDIPVDQVWGKSSPGSFVAQNS